MVYALIARRKDDTLLSGLVGWHGDAIACVPVHEHDTGMDGNDFVVAELWLWAGA
jgi:hypothetical protein